MPLNNSLPLIALVCLLSACGEITKQESNTGKNDAVQLGKQALTAQAYGRFVPEREDDFAWENDRVAFRVYGPASPAKGPASGVDAWFKSVDYPIIDKWYAEHLSGQSYHEDQGEGYDVYHTGTSRGVGGTAIWVDGKAYPAGQFSSWKLLETDSSEVSFELVYEWTTPLGDITENKVVTLPLGANLYSVESQFLLNGEVSSIPVAIGLTTHDEKASTQGDASKAYISTWELIDGIGVGTGVVLKTDLSKELKHEVSEVKDESHVWLISSTNEQGKLEFFAGFAWAKRGNISTLEDWQRYLSSF